MCVIFLSFAATSQSALLRSPEPEGQLKGGGGGGSFWGMNMKL